MPRGYDRQGDSRRWSRVSQPGISARDLGLSSYSRPARSILREKIVSARLISMMMVLSA